MFDKFRKKSLPTPQPDPSAPGDGPDFSAIDSRAKAEALSRRGELEKLFLIPIEFGGQDVPENVVFVPPFAAQAKAGLDSNVIKPLILDGKLTNYDVEPEYQGSSAIPIAITVHASDPGTFTATIDIWGDALRRKS